MADDTIYIGVGKNKRALTDREERQIVDAFKINGYSKTRTARAFGGKYSIMGIERVSKKYKLKKPKTKTTTKERGLYGKVTRSAKKKGLLDKIE